MSREVVLPRGAAGWSMSLHPRGPKWTLQWGACPATFQERIPEVDNPTVQCPSRGTWNRLLLQVERG
jgi:hypothetical protein